MDAPGTGLAGWKAASSSCSLRTSTSFSAFATSAHWRRKSATTMATGSSTPTPSCSTYRPTLAREFATTCVQQEIAESERLLSSNLEGADGYRSAVGERAQRAYDHLAEDLAMVDFRACKRAVMVGCGWRPTTAFYLHDGAGIDEIVAIDNLAEAVAGATALARRLGAGRLAVELAEAATYDYSTADLVYVEHGVAACRRHFTDRRDVAAERPDRPLGAGIAGTPVGRERPSARSTRGSSLLHVGMCGG